MVVICRKALKLISENFLILWYGNLISSLFSLSDFMNWTWRNWHIRFLSDDATRSSTTGRSATIIDCAFFFAYSAKRFTLVDLALVFYLQHVVCNWQWAEVIVRWPFCDMGGWNRSTRTFASNDLTSKAVIMYCDLISLKLFCNRFLLPMLTFK